MFKIVVYDAGGTFLEVYIYDNEEAARKDWEKLCTNPYLFYLAEGFIP